MVLMSSLEYAKTPIPLGRSLKRWSVYTPALKADVIIDVPVAKHHGSAGLSLGMKNLMGLLEPKGRARSTATCTKTSPTSAPSSSQS